MHRFLIAKGLYDIIYIRRSHVHLSKIFPCEMYAGTYLCVYIYNKIPTTSSWATRDERRRDVRYEKIEKNFQNNTTSSGRHRIHDTYTDVRGVLSAEMWQLFIKNNILMRQVYADRTPLYCRIYRYIYDCSGVIYLTRIVAGYVVSCDYCTPLLRHFSQCCTDRHRKKNVYNNTYCAWYFLLQYGGICMILCMRVSGLGLDSEAFIFLFYFFFHFDFSFIYDRWPAFKSADGRLCNKLCRTSVVAVLRRGLDKSPMRQIRYPHVYDIYIYIDVRTHTRTSPDRHER